MKKICSCLGLLGLLSTSYADDVIDRFLDEGPIDFSVLERIYEDSREYRNTLIPLPETTEQITTKEEAPLYRAILRQGSVLVRLDNRERLRLGERGIYVRAREQFPGSQISLIYSKVGEPLYYTQSVNLTDIDHIVNLYPQTDPTVIYDAPTKHHIADTRFPLENNFSFHLETMDTTLISSSYGLEDTRASGNRIQYQLFARSPLFFDYGLSISAQSLSLGSDDFGNRIRLNAIFLGPQLKYAFRKREKTYLEALLKVERSLSFKTTDELMENYYQATNWGLGLEWTRQTFLGPFFIGADYRWQTLALKESNTNLRSPVDKTTEGGFGIYLGYRLQVNL